MNLTKNLWRIKMKNNKDINKEKMIDDLTKMIFLTKKLNVLLRRTLK